MTSADTPAVPANPANQQPQPGLIQQLRANPRLPLIVGVAAAATLLVAMLLWSTGPTYGVLYSDLSDQDGGEIIAELDQMQVPYKFASNGTAILVPNNVIDQTRLTLAGQGLPKGAGAGFELMDNQSFGISQFAEHVNYKRALEGELARSIQTIASVASARVHLAIPESSVFVRERKKPSASIVLDLYRGRRLSDGQVDAVINLVASSVTDLPTDAVTVVDADGSLLSATDGNTQGANANQLDYVAQIEKNYRNRIESILAPIVGRDNIRARVVADVDFSTGERTEEIYTPNQNQDNAAVRSRQRNVSSSNGGSGTGGVPGALSNQPSPEQPSPINAPENPETGGGDGDGSLAMEGPAGLATGGGSGGRSSSSNSSTVNYEVNRTIRHITNETGQIQRVSAAVVIDYPSGTQADAEPGADGVVPAVALSDERMAQIKSLVREAIGFSAARGDSLEVINAPFNEAPDTDGAPAIEWWQNPQILAMIKTALRYLLIAIVAWLIWRKLIKPMLTQLQNLPAARVASAGGPSLGYEEDDDPQETAENAARKRQRKKQQQLMHDTRDVAKNDPRLVAMIVKNWMHGNG